MSLKIYIVYNREGKGGYADQYVSIVVCAKDARDAKKMTPYLEQYGCKTEGWKKSYGKFDPLDSWANSIKGVSAELIGIALPKMKRSVLHVSFNGI